MSTATHAAEFLRVDEAAEMLGMSAVTVRRAIAAGDLPVIQLGGPGSAIRIPRAALEASLRQASTRGN